MKRSFLSILFLAAAISSFGSQLKAVEFVLMKTVTTRVSGMYDTGIRTHLKITTGRAASLFKEWGDRSYKFHPTEKGVQNSLALLAYGPNKKAIEYKTLQTILADVCKQGPNQQAT